MNFPREHADYHRDIIEPLRITDFHRLDLAGETYLDHTGACPYPESLVMNHLWLLRENILGNPHSGSPTSARSTAALADARTAVLKFFHADPAVYDVVFTANATAAMQLVGLCYPWTPENCLVYTADVHNSALGLRELARLVKTESRAVALRPDLRVDTADVLLTLNRCPDRDGLFVYPAQCNFSGVQHPLDWIEEAHILGWRVLLDAAAYAGTNRLDLSAYPADYVAVSWYKIFGYPTGIGSLVVTHEALAALEPPTHAGGTTRAASVAADWYHLVPGVEGFEAGTVNYLAMPAVAAGCEFITSIGIEAIHDRVRLLTHWTLAQLSALAHRDGTAAVRIYGPLDMSLRGGTVAFNFLDPAGQVVDERIVSQRAAQWGISLRTGCFCTPGAGEAAFDLDLTSLAAAGNLPADTPLDSYLRVLSMPTGGAVRVSYGLASTAVDAERLIEFACSFRDQQHAATDLPPRVHC